MGIYNNRFYEWCKGKVVRDMDFERLKMGMVIDDEGQYNKMVNSRAKMSFWYWIFILFFALFLIGRMIL